MKRKDSKFKGCVACGRGFPEECKRGGKCLKSKSFLSASVELSEFSALSSLESKSDLPTQTRKHGSTAKNLKDPKSTGRKRAAQLYPLDSTAPCEWRLQKNCGGGKRPIIGCMDGFQKHRHHGPVKDTTRNHEGNVHRVCTQCHAHWHELNDLEYLESDYALLPHDPMPATLEECAMNQFEWVNGTIGKKYKLASTENHKKHKERS